jgi:hypothetical protein
MIQLDDQYAEPPLPAEPTTALAGSYEKIEIFRQRAERCEALWHPLDNRTPDEPFTAFSYRPGIREVSLSALRQR